MFARGMKALACCVAAAGTIATGAQAALPAAPTDPEDGSTYTVRDSDVGYTLRLRVTADVNNDLTPDGLDNTLPKAIEVDTAPSAVVSFRPVPGGGGGGGAGGAGGGVGGTGGGGAPDSAPPVVTALRLSDATIAPGKGATFKLRTSEAGSVTITISRSTTGRKVGSACRPRTSKNRKRKACKYQKTITTLRRSSVSAGDVAIKFSGKVKGRKLPRGRYLATIVVRDAAGNVAKAQTLAFRIVKR